jgi:hypothetical protein
MVAVRVRPGTVKRSPRQDARDARYRLSFNMAKTDYPTLNPLAHLRSTGYGAAFLKPRMPPEV